MYGIKQLYDQIGIEKCGWTSPKNIHSFDIVVLHDYWPKDKSGAFEALSSEYGIEFSFTRGSRLDVEFQ